LLWPVAVALVLSLAIHLSISGWARERRRERELFYEHETAKRMFEKEGTGAGEVDAWLRGREAERRRLRREALIFAAFVWTGLGLGMLAGLRGISRDHVYWPLGFIPLFVGLSLAIYLLFRRKETP
jgi:hypothetical protein